MTNYLNGQWYSSYSSSRSFSYICGYCGTKVGPSFHYYCKREINTQTRITGSVYICPNCNKPTYITQDEQVPGPILGKDIDYLPQDIQNLYDEARKCITVNAYTSSVLSCRKLLMNISVSKGADAGKSFGFYVTFLEDNHFIPPNSREWVDHIRKKGNEATHEIPEINKDDAIELIEFTEMLLRFIYELPGKMSKYKL